MDLVVGHNKANTLPTLRLFLAGMDTLTSSDFMNCGRLHKFAIFTMKRCPRARATPCGEVESHLRYDVAAAEMEALARGALPMSRAGAY